MAGIAVLRHLRNRGLTLRVEDDRLIVSPRELITPEIDQWIKAAREELIALLRPESTEPRPCHFCGAPGGWYRCERCVEAHLERKYGPDWRAIVEGDQVAVAVA